MARHAIDFGAIMSPLSPEFDLREYALKSGLKRSDESLPENPIWGIEYQVAEDGFVVIMLSCYGDKSAAHVWGMVANETSGKEFWAGASVQRNASIGITLNDASATFPVRAGDRFHFLQGVSGKCGVTAKFYR